MAGINPRATSVTSTALPSLSVAVVLRNGLPAATVVPGVAAKQLAATDLEVGIRGALGALRREWHEELVADFEPDFRLVGLLNDDTTDVGAVHLGAVYVADAGGRAVAIRETDKLSGDFVEPDAVAAVADLLETWSRLTFDFLGTRAAAGASADGQ